MEKAAAAGRKEIEGARREGQRRYCRETIRRRTHKVARKKGRELHLVLFLTDPLVA